MAIYKTTSDSIQELEEISFASSEAAKNGSRFDKRRWHIGDDDLVYVNNKTYAFSNQ